MDPSCCLWLFPESIQVNLWCWYRWLYIFRSRILWFSHHVSLFILLLRYPGYRTRPLEPDLISEIPFRFLISPETWLDFAILLLFYGVYFGVITKDIADVCTDRMASTIGYFSEDGMPMKHLDKTTCGICGELNVGTDENGQPEKQVLIH